MWSRNSPTALILRSYASPVGNSWTTSKSTVSQSTRRAGAPRCHAVSSGCSGCDGGRVSWKRLRLQTSHRHSVWQRPTYSLRSQRDDWWTDFAVRPSLLRLELFTENLRAPSSQLYTTPETTASSHRGQLFDLLNDLIACASPIEIRLGVHPLSTHSITSDWQCQRRKTWVLVFSTCISLSYRR